MAELKALQLGLPWPNRRGHHHRMVDIIAAKSERSSSWMNRSGRRGVVDIGATETKVVRLVLIIAESEKSLWPNGSNRCGQIEGSLTGPRHGRVGETATNE